MFTTNILIVPSISLERTVKVVDDSIKHYLSMRLRQGDGRQTQTGTTSSSANVHHNIPSPTRAPPPPPDLTAPARSMSVPNDAYHESTEPQRTIFRSLENYVFSCFSGTDCLNASFLTPDHPPLTRTMSESAVVEKPAVSRAEAFLDSSEPISELDAKTLLLGDFAENGTWWTGKSSTGRPQQHQVDPKAQEDESSDRVTSKSPRINWRELNEWYCVIFTAGKCFHASNYLRFFIPIGSIKYV